MIQLVMNLSPVYNKVQSTNKTATNITFLLMISKLNIIALYI